jgi:hypothetical protein
VPLVNFRKVRNYTAVGVGFWALIAVSLWVVDVPCGAALSTWCIESYRMGIRSALKYIFHLKWLYQYQTLIGGLAALGAGAFVLSAARYTALNERNAERMRRHEKAQIACNVASDDFFMAARSLLEIYELNPQIAPSSLVYEHIKASYLMTLHEISTALGSIVNTVHAKANAEIRRPTQNIKLVAAECYICATILAHVSIHLSDDAKYDLAPDGKIPGAITNGQITRLDLSPSDVGFLSRFIDWPRGDEMGE